MPPTSNAGANDIALLNHGCTSQEHRPFVSFESSQVVVIDNFLNEESFCRVLDYCGRSEYRNVHSTNWRKVWRIGDGNPLQGDTVYWEKDPKPDRADRNKKFYPAGTAIDLFIAGLVAALPYGERLVGAAGRDWSNLSAAPWIYPAGSALSMHQDGWDYSGAYTFFAHRQWNIHWGGYLLVLDPATPSLEFSGDFLGAHMSWIEDGKESEAMLNPGFAQCIFPRPNRLVFIAPGALHLLSRVDQNAGHHPRISIAGFFRKGPS